MECKSILISELKGSINSRPEIIVYYPELHNYHEKYDNLIYKLLPFGSNVGDIIETKLENYVILSYIFKINNTDRRDDLLSISIMLKKKLNSEIYKHILKEIIGQMETHGILSEDFLINNLESIYNSILLEKDLIYENLCINLSNFIIQMKSKYLKPKPEMKGRLF